MEKGNYDAYSFAFQWIENENQIGYDDFGIQWHPAFYGAAELEFRENKKDLIFEREYNLSKEPIRTDLLIIKKATETKIRNEIGDIFRTYNVIEEKTSATVTVPVYNSSGFLG